MRGTWLAWGAALTLVLVGLGLQVRYAEDAKRCASVDLLALCSGPLAGWLMPVTVTLGVAIVLVAGWRLALGIGCR